MAQLQNTTISSTGFLKLPAGSTGDRPGSPVTGMVRYNTTINDTEYYDGANWRPISEAYPVATGGTVTDTVIGGIPYRVHSFTTTGSSTFTVTRTGEVEYLILAGGGGGGGVIAGGGGAGGLLTGITTVTPQSYTINVGSGGQGGFSWNNPTLQGGISGTNSSALGFTASGGGGGGGHGTGCAGLSGGSGGGSGCGSGQAGTAGQGNAGGNSVGGNHGGGGGGAGSVGLTGIDNIRAGNGGQGLISTITGVSRYYAGGGGGGTRNGTGVPGFGGIGGGGRGGVADTYKEANDGAGNTGGGGGGAGHTGSSAGLVRAGGDGGSGIVIIRYRLNEDTAASATSIISNIPNSSQKDFLVQEGLVLNLDASNPLSYAASGTVTSYSSTGTVWRNLADPSVNGTINGDLTFERAAPDNGRFSFTASQYVATSNFLLGNGPTAWTMSAWVNTTTAVTSLGEGAIASNASGGPVYSSIGVNSGRISFWTYEGAWLQRIGNITVNDGRWHLLTWVNYTNSTMAMYVDGRIDVDNQRSVSGNNNPIDRFGGSWTALFNGRISQITLHLNRFLTSAEILQFYNATRWRFGV